MTTYHVFYTVEAADRRRELPDGQRAALDKMIQAVAENPYREGTHAFGGNETLRQALTPDLVCVTYQVVEDMTLIVALSIFGGVFGVS